MANLPPSNGTKGRNSGGMTGRTFKIIHSGFIPDLLNPSNTFERLSIFFFLVSEEVASLSSLSF